MWLRPGRARRRQRTFQGSGCGVWRRLCTGARRGVLPVTRTCERSGNALPGEYGSKSFLPARDSRTSRIEARRANPRRSSCCKCPLPYDRGPPPSGAPASSGPSIPSMCADWPIWPHIKAPKPPRNSRKLSMAAVSWSAIPSARWRTCSSAERLLCQEIRPRQKPPTRTSSRFWKDADQDIPSSSKPRPNTPSFSERTLRSVGARLRSRESSFAGHLTFHGQNFPLTSSLKRRCMDNSRIARPYFHWFSLSSMRAYFMGLSAAPAAGGPLRQRPTASLDNPCCRQTGSFWSIAQTDSPQADGSNSATSIP